MSVGFDSHGKWPRKRCLDIYLSLEERAEKVALGARLYGIYGVGRDRYRRWYGII
jgi:hypothetical protein